jgi:hypothetical protein
MSERAELLRAYRNTTYWVAADPEPIALRIDHKSRQLDRVLATNRTAHWAFITAWNPKSKIRPHWYNAAKQRTLLNALRRQGRQWLSGLAHADGCDWPAEPAVIVFGMTRDRARRLGRRFRQNAVVIGKRGAPALLVWCENKLKRS